MQFLLMCCADEAHWNSIATGERDVIMREYEQWVRDEIAHGRYVTGGKLGDSVTATTLRERNGKPLVLDGPFSEAKEQIGGYHVIECRDRDEAIAIAQRIPTLRAGSAVEVRALQMSLG